MNDAIDQSRCPFCLKQNGCMVQSDNPCWCNNVDIPEKLIKLVPWEFKDKTCICADCIKIFLEDPIGFQQDQSQNTNIEG